MMLFSFLPVHLSGIILTNRRIESVKYVYGVLILQHLFLLFLNESQNRVEN